jgi:hypothetical protein
MDFLEFDHFYTERWWLFFLAPWGRGRGPTRKCWEGEGEQVLQLNHLVPLISQAALGPCLLPAGEKEKGNFDSSKGDRALEGRYAWFHGEVGMITAQQVVFKPQH